MSVRNKLLLVFVFGIVVLSAAEMVVAGSGSMTKPYSEGDSWSGFQSSAQHYPYYGRVEASSQCWSPAGGDAWAWIGAIDTDIPYTRTFTMTASMKLYAYQHGGSFFFLPCSHSYIGVYFEIRDADDPDTVLWTNSIIPFSSNVFMSNVFPFETDTFNPYTWTKTKTSDPIISSYGNYLFCVKLYVYTRLGGLVCKYQGGPSVMARLYVTQISWSYD
ncbi:MAG: hypothetical protein ACFFER_08650 [Candidatus Thorarchaeota archaeon]